MTVIATSVLWDTFTGASIGSKPVSYPTATCVGPNGVGARVSTAISVETTFIDVCKKWQSKIIPLMEQLEIQNV